MKKLLLSLLLLVYGGVGLFAQKYQPKYLRQDDKAFKDLTIQTTDNGWIEFKKAARVNPTTFSKTSLPILALTRTTISSCSKTKPTSFIPATNGFYFTTKT